MKRAIFIGTTLAALGLGTATNAAEHVIMILPDAYFPAITYMDPGDTVRFVNNTGGDHNIIAKNGSWSVGPIPSGIEATMVVEEGTQMTFYDAAQVNFDGSYAIQGNLSFSSGPID